MRKKHIRKIITILFVLSTILMFFYFGYYLNQQTKTFDINNNSIDLVQLSNNKNRVFRVDENTLNQEDNLYTREYNFKFTSDEKLEISLCIGDFNGAYEMYINGKLIHTVGKLSNDDGNHILEYGFDVIDIHNTYYYSIGNENTMDINIITTLDKTSRSNWNNIFIGTKNRILYTYSFMVGLNFLIIGLFFILSILMIAIYINGNKKKYKIYFSIACFVSAIRALLLVNPILISKIIDLNYNFLHEFDYIMTLLSAILILLLFNNFYENIVNELGIKIFSIFTLFIAVVMVLIENVVPTLFKNIISPIFYGVIILITLYIIVKALIKNMDYSEILFAGFFVYMAGGVFAFLLDFDVIPDGIFTFTVNPVIIAKIICFILIAIAISVKNANSYAKMVILSEKLKELNKNLNIIVKKRTNELKKINDRLLHEIKVDGMTGLYNHNTIVELLNAEINRTERYDRNICIIMIDIDDFSHINNELGHLKGDEIIKWISNIFSENVRNMDFVGRYGGEEFLIVLPEADVDNAYSTAERIRMQVEKESKDICGYNITISLGIAMHKNDEDSIALIKRADRNLYRAKYGGKNRTNKDIY